jgi:uncharacterized protein YaaW (UPF0174 family)
VAVIGILTHGLTWGTGYGTTRGLLTGGDASHGSARPSS